MRYARIMQNVILLLLITVTAVYGVDEKLVLMGDTDYYCESYPEVLECQTQWIADNLSGHKIKLVTHTGDVVRDAGDVQQWAHAQQAFAILDGDIAQNPARLVPYSVCLGEQDLPDAGNKYSGFTYFVDSFGPQRYDNCPWYGQSHSRGTSHYQIVTIQSRTWLHLNLELEPDDGVLRWAMGVLDHHPELPVICSTHAALNDDTEEPALGVTQYGIQASNGGRNLWHKFIKHYDQIVLVLSGHYYENGGENHTVFLNRWGREVIFISSCFEQREQGGNGWLKLIEFKELAKVLKITTYSPWLDRGEYDAQSYYSVPLNFPQRLSDFQRPPAMTDVQAGMIKVTHNSYDNIPSSVTLDIPNGEKTPLFYLRTPNSGNPPTNTGDYVIKIGDDPDNDLLNGVMLSCVTENGRVNDVERNYHIASSAGSDYGSYFIATHAAPSGLEDNVNVAAAYFPFSGGWSCGRVVNLENDKPMFSVMGSETIELGSTLIALANSEKPYGGTRYAGSGVWRLSLPLVNTLSDGVLMVCGGKNENNYAAASPTDDGSAWIIAVHDNTKNDPQTEQDPFSFVYIPYDTSGITAARVSGNAGIYESCGQFSLDYAGIGTYHLRIADQTPHTGVLLVTTGAGHYADDNIVLYNQMEDYWIIQTRDLPTMRPQNTSDHSFSFAFIPYQLPPTGPGMRRPLSVIATSAGLIDVTERDSLDYTVSVAAATTHSGGRMTIPLCNRGDIVPHRAGAALDYHDGILLACAAEVERDNGEGLFNAVISAPRKGFSGSMAVSAHNAFAADDKLEVNVNVAAAWFPFLSNRSCGHINASGTIEAAAGTAPTVLALGSGRYRLRLGTIDSQHDGMLLVIANSDHNHTANAAIEPDGSWSIAIQGYRNGELIGIDDDFSYLYVPYGQTEYLIAQVEANGTVAAANGCITVNHIGPGHYQLNIANGLPHQGILLPGNGLTSIHDNADTLWCYQLNEGSFEIVTYNRRTHRLEDGAFGFAYIPFDSDWHTIGATDLDDFQAFQAAWQSTVGDEHWDRTWDLYANDIIDMTDLAIFSAYWLADF